MSREDQVAAYVARIASRQPIENLERLVRTSIPIGLESAESPESLASSSLRENAAAGLRAVTQGRIPTPEQTAGLEAIILPKIRPVLDVIDGSFKTDHPLWLKLNDDANVRARLLTAIPSIGRIELPGNPYYPYGGTGFVVGPGLLMTNRHVAAIFSNGVGTRGLSFKPGLRAGIDFLRELDRPTGPTLMAKRVVMVHPYWDMALLAVDGLPSGAQPLTLSQRDVQAGDMVEVAAIGYPAFDIRNDADVQNDVFRRVFGVKRLQPGTFGGRRGTASFGKMVPAVLHNCSTLGGNSGSALIDFETGEVIGLHFGGRYRKTNFAVPTCELARDDRVVDAGIQFTGPRSTNADLGWAQWWNRADEMLIDDEMNIGNPPVRSSDVQASTDMSVSTTPAGAVQLVIPLPITIHLDRPGRTLKVGSPGDELDGDLDVERLAIPWHDVDYTTRTGYHSRFLGVEIPMPKSTEPTVVAGTKAGGTALHYENFSIVMHAKRRMALFTASNVTAEPELKKPEPGRVYTRKALSGLGKNDQERWFPDPRLDDAFQLPDVFYTRDDGAFDKGHIVRREDVAWGENYDTLRRANGDTYHVTNCSPQVAGFNRGSLGEDNWGDLEDHVLSGAASERYCQFAGPILDDRDEVFVGAGGGRVRLRIKIPSRYWKVIVFRTDHGVASYGFVLEQDLSAVQFEEFVVPENFRRFMEPLTDLSKRAGILFPDIVLNADQYDTEEGIELALRAGTKRRSGGKESDHEAVVV